MNVPGWITRRVLMANALVVVAAMVVASPQAPVRAVSPATLPAPALPTPALPAPAPALQRNFALGAVATQSSTANDGVANYATDGWTSGYFPHSTVTATGAETNPWWQVDMGESHDIDLVRIWNRTDCCQQRLNDFWVFLSAVPFTSNDPAVVASDRGVTAIHITQSPKSSVEIPVTALARYVRVQLVGRGHLSLAEVQVIGQPWVSNLATDAVTSQSSSRYDGDASHATDGNTDGDFSHQSVSHTRRQLNPWWQADLGHSRTISEVRVWNRTDQAGERLQDFWVQVSDVPFTSNDPVAVASQATVTSIHITSAPSPMIAVPVNTSGRYVRIQIPGTEFLSLAEVEILGPQLRNLVPGGVATQSSTEFNALAENAQDGNTDGNFGRTSVTHTAGQANPWWQVNLGDAPALTQVKIWNRTDCCTDRLRDFWVFLSPTPFVSDDPAVTAAQPQVTAYHVTSVPSPFVLLDVDNLPTQYIRVQIPGGGILSLAEVEAFGTESHGPVDALGWNAEHRFGMFLHYGLGTETDAQWSPAGTPASHFNPPATIDPTQWVTTMKSAGMTWAALTAKHHDGFALWPTAYSSHSVAGSPYQNGQGDIVRDYANAMHAGGLDVGIYFSLWDITNGETPALVKNQIRELLTHYGPITYMFLDASGAEFAGPNKISYNELRDFIRDVSPDTVIANNDHRFSLTSSDFLVTEYHDYIGGWPAADDTPKEVATMLDSRYTWFWTTTTEGPKKAAWVVDLRDKTYAVNGHFLLNVGPRRDGTLDPRYVSVLEAVGATP